MERHEARLEKARRRLEEQETLVTVYRGVHDALEQSAQPSEVSTKMLQALERTLAKFRADVVRLSN
jgi:hypothetical protein